MCEGYEANKHLVDLKTTSNPDLFVLKYKRKVFYDNKWNDFLEDCRGTIVDKDFNVVSLPFRKIYNYGIEERAPKIDDEELVLCYRKINGFMVAVTEHNSEQIVSTTGSIDSDFVKIATSWVKKLGILSNNEYTDVYECCDVSDPHIISETPGLYYLGSRNKFDGNVEDFREFYSENVKDMHFPEYQYITMAEVKKQVKSVNHEGFVVYTTDGRSTKIKSPYYLVKKLFARGNLEKLFARDIKKNIDEEYYKLVDYLKENRKDFELLDEQQRLRFIEDYLSND